MVSFCYSMSTNTILSPFIHQINPLYPTFTKIPIQERQLLRGKLFVTRAGLSHVPGPEFGGIFERIEGLLYTIADASVNSVYVGNDANINDVDIKENGDWLSGITNGMESVLKFLKDGLSTVHVPYSYGFAIILLTILVKAVTFPLTKKQVESTMAMRSLAPQIKAIQERYAGDQERIQLETARLYKLAGINPLAGCLPTLATIPIWIGLYRALSNVANEGLLTEGFFWIPSLAGPTTIASRQTGSGISWLFPFVDGHPPLGWSDTLAYLALPVLLVISQYISIQIMQPSQSNDPNQKTSQAITKFLPLMVGYFALSVPSGLGLYWFTNNILSTAQQIWLQKLGGARNPVIQVSEDLNMKHQLRSEKSVSESVAVNKTIEVEQKKTAEGPRPGERFKQLKEQEAQKKRQREEMKKAAEAISEKGAQTEKDESNKVGLVDKKKDNGIANSHTGSSISNSRLSSITENGNSTSPRLSEDQVATFNGQSPSNSTNGESSQHPHENIEKEEAIRSARKTGSVEDAQEDTG
ncbi:hypothetical protein Leryth_018018 [Lithospermum erythrorhizon]|nr:hypothetical protein Leryth_018018 [Lithospermum erythrorhizon]